MTIQDKNSITETRLYEQMGLTASTMAYSWSKWNGEKESEKIIFQSAPQLKDEPLTEVTYYLITNLISNMPAVVILDSDYCFTG